MSEPPLPYIFCCEIGCVSLLSHFGFSLHFIYRVVRPVIRLQNIFCCRCLKLFRSAALLPALHPPLQYLNRIRASYIPDNIFSRVAPLLSFAAACAPLLMFVLPFAPFVFASTDPSSSPVDSAAKFSLLSTVLEYCRYACGLRLLGCICFCPCEYIHKVTIGAGQCALIQFDTQVSFMRLPSMPADTAPHLA